MTTKFSSQISKIDSFFSQGNAIAQKLCQDWMSLCETHLPLISDDPLWRYSRSKSPKDREQGWKLHISATALNANQILEKVAPLLKKSGVLFKAPSSLPELGKLNSGLYYGYSQIGKFITVYPQTDKDAVYLAKKLHKLTYGLPAPLIPFDTRFRKDSCIYYRYGAFKHLEIENSDGTRTLAIRNPDGELIPDIRDNQTFVPAWTSNPFPAQPKVAVVDNPFKNKYKVFRALAQRGKGGVYQAVDISSPSPRLCLIKEGRKHGEVDWDGHDGYWHVKREADVLTLLKIKGPNVPAIYSTFESERNFYLVTEYIEGKSLHQLLTARSRRLSISQALKFSIDICSLMSEIHRAGWVWRDCKPANIIVTKDGNLRPVDFEGACLIDKPEFTLSGTPDFLPPEWNQNFQSRSKISSDLFTLGAVIYYLFTGQFYSGENPVSIKKLRRYIPLKTQKIIERLLLINPIERPDAQTVKNELKEDLKLITERCSA